MGSQKRNKTGLGRWSDLVSSYRFFFAGLLAMIFTLLLISVWKEFSDMTGSRYESVADMVAIVFVILLLIVWSMRWTYPMSIEEPLIIILIWIILSGRISHSHCFCCHGNRPVTVLHTATEGDAAVAHHTPPPPDHDLMLEAWQLLVHECDPEAFNFLYSLLCLVLVLVASLTELRNYYVSLLFRLTTAALIAILLILLVVSPSLCSKFRLSDSLILLVRVTFFLALGWMNRYRRATERWVMRDYAELVGAALDRMTDVPAHLQLDGGKSSTPRALFLHFSRTVRYLAARSGGDGDDGTKKRRRRKDDDANYPLGRAEIEDDEAEDEDEEEQQRRELARFKRRRENKEASRLQSAAATDGGSDVENLTETQTDIMIHTLNMSNRYKKNYLSSVVCWKHRSHSKHLLHLIDLAYILWILIVCPVWLLFIPLQIGWLLYCISVNTYELAETRKFVTLQSAVVAKTTEFAISIT